MSTFYAKYPVTSGGASGVPVDFGDGADGDIILDGTNDYPTFLYKSGNSYYALRTIFANSLTINAGKTLITGPYILYVAGTLANAGVISSNGGSGGSATGATGGTGANATTAQWAVVANGLKVGTATLQAYFGSTGEGASGSTATGADGSPTSSGPCFAAPLGGSGGAGGSGGSGPGGATVLSGDPTSALSVFEPRSMFALASSGVSQLVPVAGGSGGSAGAGDGVNSGGGGGGGGFSGYTIVIFADTLNNTGFIASLGGNGGAGGNGDGVGNTGGGGGGGGGAGGIIYLITNTTTLLGTISADGGVGGVGGTKHGTGVNGSSGGDGSLGVALHFEASTAVWTQVV